MRARVTTILVAHDGARFLGRTLVALAGQTRPPDFVAFVDAASTDESAALLAEGNPALFVAAKGKASFASAVAQALRSLPPSEGIDEWLWLLRHDSAPQPGALAALLAAVEVAPSVAVAGPKLMSWDRGDVIADYGQSVTRGGASVALVVGELDQGQHDRQSDLLAVAAEGMLVRRSVFSALAGFDPSLPALDASLDFCMRARLAGHRVIGVPDAKIASAGGPETFARGKVSRASLARLGRAAELHRRLVLSPAVALPAVWLSLVPIAVLRSTGHIAGKRPWAIPGEFGAALATAFGGGVGAARRNLARTRTLGLEAIAPFYIPAGDARELRAIRAEREIVRGESATPIVRPGFFAGGGAWVVLILVGVGLGIYFPLLGAPAVSGGGVLPLSPHVSQLWSNVGYGWRSAGTGFVGAADPFAYLIAILGTIFFWAPSTGVVVLYLAALPLAGLAAWFCAARFSLRGWAPAAAAVLWAFAPPFLQSLNSGHLGAVIAHLLLPWLVLATVNAARSWSAAGAASILFAATLASSPVLAPALLVALLAWMIARPSSILRIVGIPLPSIALFAPLVMQQIARGNPLGIFADPGVPVVAGRPSGWQLALGATGPDLNEWTGFASALGVPPSIVPVVVAALLAPFAALALLAIFLPGSRRTIPALALALLGFLTAVASTHLEVSHVGEVPVAIWAGAGISLFWLGLVGSVVVAIDVLAGAAPLPALLTMIGAITLVVPLASAPILGLASVGASNGRVLPAFVTAEASSHPGVGTLVLIPTATGAIEAHLERGAGTTLDAQSTLASTSLSLSANDSRVAVLAANLATQSGYDAEPGLNRLQIAFVLVPESEGQNQAHDASVNALGANPAFTTIGVTSKGLLWHYTGLHRAADVAGPGPTETPMGIAIVIGQSIVFGLGLLLAIPTGGRSRRSTRVVAEDAVGTFEEDPDDDV